MDTRQIKLVDVNPYVMCTLCSGYIVDATTIIECLHSFCKTCIYRYLESNKLCPICDVLVHKTRPLLNVRPDKTFQALIYKIVPGLYKDEMDRRRSFYAENSLSGFDPISVNVSEQQATDDYPSISVLSPSEALPDWVSLCLELSDRLPPFAKVAFYGQKCIQASGEPVRDQRHLLCPAGLTVGHLKKFLRGKFDLFTNLHIDVFHSDEILKDIYSLSEIANIYTWRRVEPLKLYYVVYDIVNSQAVDFSVALRVDNDRVIRDNEAASSVKANTDFRQTTLATTSASNGTKTISVKRRKLLQKNSPSTETRPLEFPKTVFGDVSTSDLACNVGGNVEVTDIEISNATLIRVETLKDGTQSLELSGEIIAKCRDISMNESRTLETFCETQQPDSSSIHDPIDPCTVETSAETETNGDKLVESNAATKVLSTTTPNDNEQRGGDDECVPGSNNIEEKCGFESQLASSDVENHDQTKKENRPAKKRSSEVEQLFLDRSSTREVRNLYREFATSARKRGRSSQLRLRLRPGSVVRRRSVGLTATRSGKTRAATSTNRSKSYPGRAKVYVVRRKLAENNKKK